MFWYGQKKGTCEGPVTRVAPGTFRELNSQQWEMKCSYRVCEHAHRCGGVKTQG